MRRDHLDAVLSQQWRLFSRNTVTRYQEPETSFAADVAATRRVLNKAITETGMHPDIKALG